MNDEFEKDSFKGIACENFKKYDKNRLDKAGEKNVIAKAAQEGWRCQDYGVGVIDELRSDPGGFTDQYASPPESGKRLFLVLESPHVQEFKAGELDARPARGQTGVQIRKYLRDLCNSRRIDTDRKLVLMNAIQYQCSLGLTLKKPQAKALRDDVFAEFWKKVGREDFQQRLFDRYKLRDEDVVINCCTRGGKDHPLQEWVNKAILDCLGEMHQEIRVYSANHPASWRSENNRKRIDPVNPSAKQAGQI